MEDLGGRIGKNNSEEEDLGGRIQRKAWEEDLGGRIGRNNSYWLGSLSRIREP